jgi:hypothetical protein
MGLVKLGTVSLDGTKINVLPLDDRSYERFNAAVAGRPDLMGDRKSLTLYEGMELIMENVFINVKNRSHVITAEVEIPEGGGEETCKGSTGTLFINDKKVADGEIGKTVGFIFSTDETADVGSDHHTPVSPEYPQRGNEFTGKIGKVTIDLK